MRTPLYARAGQYAQGVWETRFWTGFAYYDTEWTFARLDQPCTQCRLRLWWVEGLYVFMILYGCPRYCNRVVHRNTCLTTKQIKLEPAVVILVFTKYCPIFSAFPSHVDDCGQWQWLTVMQRMPWSKQNWMIHTLAIFKRYALLLAPGYGPDGTV